MPTPKPERAQVIQGPPAPRRTPGGKDRCDAMADDGAQCVRTKHDDEAHDFAGQSPAEDRVDGGRRWSDWISMVNASRDLLMPQQRADGVGRQGRVGEWSQAYCQQILSYVAQALQLSVAEEDGVLVIREQ